MTQLRTRWDAVKALFESLAGLTIRQRALRLQEIESGSVKAEIERLLQNNDEAASGFLPSDPERTASASLLQGERIFHPDQIAAERFRIIRFLGRGGMGEVYSAEDLRTGIEVAVKAFSSGPSSPQRSGNPLRREVQMARRITHENVCRIHDLFVHETADRRVLLLSMELIEGETLSELLAREGPLTPARCEPLLSQLLAGLSAAHKAGILHRDLKPRNIMLTHRENDGSERLVILDFGLARPSLPQPGDSFAGEIAGTFEYMAPEQLRGDAKAETDIYAVGLILFEMLTGRRPFEGPPFAQALRRTSEDPVRPRAVVPAIPAVWEQVILRCLAREPSARFSDPQEISQALTDGLPERRALKWKPWAWLLTAAAFLLASGLAVRRFESRGPVAVKTAQVALVPASTTGGLTMDSTISPDGKLLAYVSDRGTGGNLELFVQQSNNEATARQLTSGTNDKSEPSFSPDGALIVYSTAPKGLSIIPSAGGSPRLLAAEGSHGRFSPDGTKIAYFAGDDAEHPIGRNLMYVIPASGGTPMAVASEFYGARRPVWLPDGHHILFEGWRDRKSAPERDAELYILDLTSGAVTATGALPGLRSRGLRLFNQLGNFSGDSLLLSARLESAANVYRVSFNPRTRKISGAVEQLTTSTSLMDSPVVSAGGTLAVTSVEGELNIWDLSLTGGHVASERRITDSLSYDTYPTISKDGSILSFTRTLGQERQIWVRSMPSGMERLILGTKDEKLSPVIRPDGKEIVYRSQSERGNSIRVVSTNDGAAETLCDDCGTPTGWSSSGEQILLGPDGESGISVLDRRSRVLHSLYRQPGVELSDAQIAPNAKWIVFAASYGHQRRSLILAPYGPGSDTAPANWRRITDGRFRDQKPRWSDDGSRIYFESDRDGFQCIWQQPINPVDNRPTGMPIALRHYHAAANSLGEASEAVFNLAVNGNRIFLNVPHLRGNVWLGTIAR